MRVEGGSGIIGPARRSPAKEHRHRPRRQPSASRPMAVRSRTGHKAAQEVEQPGVRLPIPRLWQMPVMSSACPGQLPRHRQAPPGVKLSAADFMSSAGRPNRAIMPEGIPRDRQLLLHRPAPTPRYASHNLDASTHMTCRMSARSPIVEIVHHHRSTKEWQSAYSTRNWQGGLQATLTYTLKEAVILIERWLIHYNTIRPHSSLVYQPPAPQTILPHSAGRPYAALQAAQHGDQKHRKTNLDGGSL